MMETETYSAKYCMNQVCEGNLPESLLINYPEAAQDHTEAGWVIWSLCPKSGLWKL